MNKHPRTIPGTIEPDLMKLLDVKGLPQGGLHLPPQLNDLQLAELVAHGLAWPRHVPVHSLTSRNCTAMFSGHSTRNTNKRMKGHS